MLRKLFVAASLLCAAPATAAWHEASGKHFVVYSDDDAESVQAFAAKLERYDKAMRVIRELPDESVSPASRLTVYVVDSVAAVRRLYGDRNSNVAGFYVPRAGGSVAIVPRSGGRAGLDPELILLHEYAHHFMLANYPAAFPFWFVEGFAEFYSTAKFEKDGTLGLGMPAQHRAWGIFNSRLSAEEMLGLTSGSKLSDEEVGGVYSRGWLLTHYLTFEETRRGQLTTYLKEMNSGAAPLDAARKAFGDLKLLERDLNAYAKRRKLQYVKMAREALTIEPVKVRTLTPAEAAVMDVKIQSRRGVTHEQATKLLPEMRRRAAAFPNDPFAQATLAEGEYDADNLAEADAAAGRALATDPRFVHALIYKGMARLALAEKAKSQDPAVWREARKWLLDANRIDPDHPEPLMLFYGSYRRAGAKPTPNAVDGLNRALELAPHDGELRLIAARQYLMDGKAAEARAALKPIAYNPHAGTLGTAISAVLEALDGDDTARALSRWNALDAEHEAKAKAEKKEG